MLEAISPREATEYRGERPYEFRQATIAGKVKITWINGRPRVIRLVRRCA